MGREQQAFVGLPSLDAATFSKHASGKRQGNDGRSGARRRTLLQTRPPKGPGGETWETRDKELSEGHGSNLRM